MRPRQLVEVDPRRTARSAFLEHNNHGLRAHHPYSAPTSSCSLPLQLAAHRNVRASTTADLTGGSYGAGGSCSCGAGAGASCTGGGTACGLGLALCSSAECGACHGGVGGSRSGEGRCSCQTTDVSSGVGCGVGAGAPAPTPLPSAGELCAAAFRSGGGVSSAGVIAGAATQLPSPSATLAALVCSEGLEACDSCEPCAASGAGGTHSSGTAARTTPLQATKPPQHPALAPALAPAAAKETAGGAADGGESARRGRPPRAAGAAKAGAPPIAPSVRGGGVMSLASWRACAPGAARPAMRNALAAAMEREKEARDSQPPRGEAERGGGTERGGVGGLHSARRGERGRPPAPALLKSARVAVERVPRGPIDPNQLVINLKDSKNAAGIVREVALALGWRESACVAEDCNANVFW